MSEYIDLRLAAERVRKRLERIQRIQDTLAEVLQDSIEEQRAIELQLNAGADENGYHHHKRESDK